MALSILILLAFATPPPGAAAAEFEVVDKLTVNGVTSLNGNLGIGTSGPVWMVDVRGLNPSIQLKATAGGTPSLLLDKTQTIDSAYVLTRTAGANRWGFGMFGDELLRIIYGTSADTRMLFDGSGNVGIGTTGPGSKLHVSNGNLQVDTGWGIRFGNSTNMIIGASGAGGYQVFQVDSAERMRLTAAGNLGIRQPSPLAPLEVRGVGNDHTMFVSTNTVDYSAPNLVVTNSGSVGIGSTSPSGALDVNGVIFGQSSTGSGDVLRVGNDSKLTDIDVANTMGLYGISDPTKGHLKLGSSGPTLSGSSGNVGIGSAAPVERLDVGGAVRIGSTASTCDSTRRGATRVQTAGEKDVVEICLKNEAGAFNWTEIESGEQMFDNGAGGRYRPASTSRQAHAQAACESYYGVGACSTGSCGNFTYYYASAQPQCDCNKPVGGYEWIYSNSGYTGVGSDYGGRATSVAGDQLFTRVKATAGCSSESWELALRDLGEVPGDGVPAGAVMFFNLAACPGGWTELTSARGRAVVGLPASGTLAGVAGTALSDLQSPSHTHAYSTVIAHTHTVDPPSTTSSSDAHSHTVNVHATVTDTSNGAQYVSGGDHAAGGHFDADPLTTSDAHTHTTNVAAFTSGSTGSGSGVTGSTEGMPYIQLIACQKI